jgi:hypothetical protein
VASSLRIGRRSGRLRPVLRGYGVAIDTAFESIDAGSRRLDRRSSYPKRQSDIGCSGCKRSAKRCRPTSDNPRGPMCGRSRGDPVWSDSLPAPRRRGPQAAVPMDQGTGQSPLCRRRPPAVMARRGSRRRAWRVLDASGSAPAGTNVAQSMVAEATVRESDPPRQFLPCCACQIA